ncbi:hypothetical protein Dsin_011701 [Dipteronia sinensis]|uniref:RNase H type-1 domain-containing protein n=1 Tax=Dipteronia sinensis TaxID=43782 RepID=A0AAE0E7C6_9ROSI|nr:hypothetical protein Dsin_011701 [Dipteronia sinensis]
MCISYAKFTSDEIKRAVFDMSPSKAPSLDGFLTLFYQKYWSTVGDKVTSACLGVLNNGVGLDEVNETLIILIPKVKRAKRLSEFSPISLCNVIYNVVLKSLATRLRAMLNDVISETQNAFIPGRLISVNAIVCFECMQSLKRRKKKEENVHWLSNWTCQRPLIGWSGILSQKSALCVSKRVTRLRAENLAGILGVRLVACHECYLGLPSFVGKNKNELFASICNRVWNRVKRWQNKFFSSGGKKVLLKVVVQSIPTYSMSLFKLRKTLISDLHRLSARFWWGSKDERRKIHWVCWRQRCRSKDDGELGFHDLSNFNQAFMVKQVWRIHYNPYTLAAKVLSHCYFADSSVLMAGYGSSSSYMWRSFVWGRELLEKGSRYLQKLASSDVQLGEAWLAGGPLVPILFNRLESTMHALWSYPALKVVRNGFVKIKGLTILDNMNFLDFMLSCINQVLATDIKGNAFVHNLTDVNIMDIIPWAEDFLNDLMRVDNMAKNEHGGYELITPSWRPPDAGIYKVNTNVAIDDKGNRTRTGVIIRDYRGLVMASCAHTLTMTYSPLMSEVLAILQGLHFAFESGLWPCILESDSQVAISLINSNIAHMADIGLIVGDIQNIVIGSPSCKVCFISRKANKVACGLAKLGLSIESMEEVPPSVAPIM